MDIVGKTAIVLGGTSGIGLETSVMLVKRSKRGRSKPRPKQSRRRARAAFASQPQIRVMPMLLRLLTLKGILISWSIQQPAVLGRSALLWKWT